MNIVVDYDYEAYAADIAVRAKESVMEIEAIIKMTIQLAQSGYLQNTSEEKLKDILDGLEDSQLTDVMIASDEILTEILIMHFDSLNEDLR